MTYLNLSEHIPVHVSDIFKKLTKHLEIQTITTEHMLHIPHILQQTDKNKMAVREDFCEELCKHDDS